MRTGPFRLALLLMVAVVALPAAAFNYDLGFWLSRVSGSQDVLADAQMLGKINAAIESTGTGVVSLKDYPSSIDAFALTGYLKLPTLPGVLYTADGLPASAGAIAQISSKVKPESVSAYGRVRYGISAAKADLRLLPSSERLFDKRTGGIDVLQAGRLLIGEPVVILYETQDKTWLFVQSARQRGWVASIQVAVALTREHWESYAFSKDFLIITAPSIFVEQEGSSAPLELPMGSRLPLVPANSLPEVVKNRGALDSYVALIPQRKADGKLNATPILIPRTADVSESYLPLSGENIAKQAMKLVGSRYGNKGHLGRDSYMLVSDVYRCMGIEMPASSAGYAALPFISQDIKQQAADLKLLAFRKALPGSILMLESGPSIYLGQYGEDVYVIAALAVVRMPSKSAAAYELLDMPFNGVGLVSLKSVYSQTGNDFFTEALYLIQPMLK